MIGSGDVETLRWGLVSGMMLILGACALAVIAALCWRSGQKSEWSTLEDMVLKAYIGIVLNGMAAISLFLLGAVRVVKVLVAPALFLSRGGN